MANEDLSRRSGTTDYGKLYEQKVSALLGVRCALNDDIEDMWMATNISKLPLFGQFAAMWNAYKLLVHNSVMTLNPANISIIFTKNISSLEQYRSIEKDIQTIRKRDDQTVHYFRFIDKSKLEWLHSNHNIDKIKPYIIAPDSFVRVPDSELFHHLDFNIISAKAGEGKSTLLQYLTYNCPPNTWVVQLHMKDLTEFISKGDFSDIRKFLYNHSSNTNHCSKFTWKLYQHLCDKLNALIIIDGLDEVEFVSTVEEFFNAIKTLGIKVVIAIRPSLKDFLEEKYQTLSFFLDPFTYEDRQSLVKLTLQSNYDKFDEIEVENVLQRISLWDNIVGVPLILALFVTLLNDGKHLDFNTFDITDLYDAYIHGQLEKVNSCNKFTMRTLSRAALSVFYKVRALSDLFNVDEYFEDIEDKSKIFKKSRLIENFYGRESPTFAHKSIAEFLAGKYLAILAEKLQGDVVLKFMKSLFYKELELVRLFFDKIALKNSPLQKVLNENNLENLKFDEDLTDAFGRNSLHIIACYGNRSELRTIDSLWSGVKIYESYNKKHSNGIELGQPFERRKTVCLNFFENLLEIGFDPFKKDTLYKMDVFDFAIESGSLEMAEALFNKSYMKKLEEVNPDILLYYAIRNGYINIFNHVENKNFKLKLLPLLQNLLHIGLTGENFDIICELTNNMVDIDEPDIFGCTPLVSWITPSKVTFSQYNSHSVVISRKFIYDKNHLRILKHMLSKNTNINKTNVIGETILHVACTSREKPLLEMLLENNADVNIQTKLGDTPLHYASQHSLEYVKLLVKHKSEVDVANLSGFTPLCVAAQKNLQDIVKYLIKQKAFVNRNNEQITPLYAAIIGGHDECIKLLLRHHAKINNSNTNNSLGLAVLYGHLNCVITLIKNGAKTFNELLGFAVLNNHKEIIKYLLSGEFGMNVDTCLNGTTPLFHLVEMENIDTMEILLSYGADANIQANNGCTPLMKASALGLVNIADFLILHGSEVNKESGGSNPLFEAATYGQLECIKLLIDKGSDLQKYGSNALYIAAKLGHYAVVDYFISRGRNNYNTSATNTMGQIATGVGTHKEAAYFHEALALAAQEGNLKCLKIFIDKGCNVRKYGPRAIYSAALGGHIDVLDYLISVGANINGTVDECMAPIHVATIKADLTAIKSLVSKGADINLKSLDNGLTPLMFAVFYGEKGIMEYFVENGAKLDEEHTNKQTAFTIASQEGHLECVTFLVSRGSNVRKYGSLAIWLAACHGHIDVVKYIISAGGDINGMINNDKGAIHYAVLEGNIKVVKDLLSMGAQINLKAVNRCYTPLMLAGCTGRKNILEYLIENQAALDEVGSDHHSALTLASSEGHLECAQLLVNKGCDLGRYGPLSLYYAAKGKRITVVDYFTQLITVHVDHKTSST